MLEEYSLESKTAIVTGAGIALILASAASDMVTVQNIYIYGGLTSGG